MPFENFAAAAVDDRSVTPQPPPSAFRPRSPRQHDVVSVAVRATMGLDLPRVLSRCVRGGLPLHLSSTFLLYFLASLPFASSIAKAASTNQPARSRYRHQPPVGSPSSIDSAPSSKPIRITPANSDPCARIRRGCSSDSHIVSLAVVCASLFTRAAFLFNLHYFLNVTVGARRCRLPPAARPQHWRGPQRQRGGGRRGDQTGGRVMITSRCPPLHRCSRLLGCAGLARWIGCGRGAGGRSRAHEERARARWYSFGSASQFVSLICPPAAAPTRHRHWLPDDRSELHAHAQQH